jgi:hypothetical protein
VSAKEKKQSEGNAGRTRLGMCVPAVLASTAVRGDASRTHARVHVARLGKLVGVAWPVTFSFFFIPFLFSLKTDLVLGM